MSIIKANVESADGIIATVVVAYNGNVKCNVRIAELVVRSAFELGAEKVEIETIEKGE